MQKPSITKLLSIGAYTARALAGMIEKVGLLPAGNHQQVPFAYKMYMQDDDMGSCLSHFVPMSSTEDAIQDGSRVCSLCVSKGVFLSSLELKDP